MTLVPNQRRPLAHSFGFPGVRRRELW